MQRNKQGFCVLFFVTIAAIISSQASAQLYLVEFDNNSAFASGQGIGASQLVKADAFNMVNITTVDLFAPEFADDGTGTFAPTGNTLFASSGDGVTTQTTLDSLGIANLSDPTGDESRFINDGEGWVVEFDEFVLFESLNLSSVGDGTLTVTIEGIGSFDFVDVGIAGDVFTNPLGLDFIPAGRDITFAYSSTAPANSGSLRINSFTFVTGVVADGVGDINQDGCINFGDIPAFIAILTSGVYDPFADLNFDGDVNFSDIPPFIQILSSI